MLLNETPTVTSRDSNHNGIPDECEMAFHRADRAQSESYLLSWDDIEVPA